MKKIKTLLAAVMALSLCMSLLPMNAFAAWDWSWCDTCGRYGHDPSRWCETCQMHDGHDPEKWCDICKSHGHTSTKKDSLCHCGNPDATESINRRAHHNMPTYNAGYNTCKTCGGAVEHTNHADDNVTWHHDHECDICHATCYIYGTDESTTATCTEPGVTKTICKYCKDVLEKEYVIPGTTARETPALGHSEVLELVDTLTPATCTEPGWGVYRCKHINNGVRCEYTEEKEIPALNHQLTTTPASDPDCIHDGTYGYVYCSRCEKYFTDSSATTETTVEARKRAAAGHQFPTTWTDDNSGVYGTDGTHSHVCSVCNNTLTDGKETADHTFTDNWSEWRDYDRNDHGLNPTATQKVQYHTRQCTANGCTHTERGFQVVDKDSKTVNVQYVEQGNTTNVLGTASFTLLEDGTGEGTVAQRDDFAGFRYVEGAGVPVTFDGSTDGQILMVYYARNSYTLTVEYRGLPAGLVSNPDPRTLDYEDPIEVEIPNVTGYSQTTVTVNDEETTIPGTMPDHNVAVIVNYTVNQYPLTIVYTGLPTALAFGPVTSQVNFGANVVVNIPAVDGYTGAIRDAASVPATMPAGPLTVYVDYTANAPDTYSLYIEYVYADGTQAATAHNESLPAGDNYSVTSPVIEGYTPDRAVVSGSMGNGNAYFLVTYTADTVIEEPEPPLEEQPELPEQPDEPDPQPAEPIEIDEPDVPLAEQPVEIDEPDVPLADVPKTGDNSYIWSLTAVLSGTGLAWLTLRDRKRKIDAE